MDTMDRRGENRAKGFLITDLGTLVSAGERARSWGRWLV